jgi:hypothetical protein
MAYHSTDVNGVTLINPDKRAMREIICSVFDADDSDYPDVSLMHESGWTLVYSDTKTLLLENAEKEDGIRFMREVSPADTLKYWVLLSQGKIKSLLSLQWSSQA